MKRRRVLGYRPPVLLLGAGASFEAGIGTMTQLFQFTKVKDFDQTHPFAPVLFEVPEGLNAPGLRLDASPLMPPLAVRVGVAAGERVGISSGAIIEVDERRLPIAPVGEVDRLIAIDCVVAPGSTGAPVLDAASLAVRGYIVAGSTDKPPSFMYPAYRWAGAVGPKPSRQN